MPVEEPVGSKRHGYPRAHIVTDGNGAQKIGSRPAFSFSHGECGRYDGAPRMGKGGGMRIVGFVGMRAHAVRQGGEHGTGKMARAENRGFRIAAKACDEGDYALTGRQPRPADDRGYRIEYVKRGLVGDLARQGPRGRCCDMVCERSGNHDFRFSFSAPR
jgi:hypothetical protein